MLPSSHPDGTKVYKDRALRTPFSKVSSSDAPQQHIITSLNVLPFNESNDPSD